MNDTRYYCDKCGDRISLGDRSTLTPKFGVLRGAAAIDLCGECSGKLRTEFLRPGPVLPVENPTPARKRA